jgi:histidine ammonia-lyase
VRTSGWLFVILISLIQLRFRKLQLNLIRSHATGYGPHLEPSMARMLLALRINVLAKGHSGISLENVEKLVNAFNGK